MSDFSTALDRYQELGVNVEEALAALQQVPLSMHCWQGDDVGGFESSEGKLSGGGIQVTGNYPGKARSIDELQKDVEYAMSLIPGSQRLNLHAMYGDFGGKKVDRNQVDVKHFAGWMDWSREKSIPLDFNASCFSHPKANDGFTLSSLDKGIRDFWIEHVSRVRTIGAAFGKNQGSACVHNLWIPDGTKDYPAQRMVYRQILTESLDTIFAQEHSTKHLRDAVEAKLFGIGSETFVVGSHEFYLGYAMSRKKMICLDLGHFHPTESLADKLSSVFLFMPEILLHVSRPMRWDSDHVVLFNDDIRHFMQELVRCNGLNRTYIGLDFFDATLNRIGAWAIGSRSTMKGILYALLEPQAKLMEAERAGDAFSRMALLEQGLTLPFGQVWDEYCVRTGVPTDGQLIQAVKDYEQKVLSKRG
jgi:L-rhamnose isomerase